MAGHPVLLVLIVGGDAARSTLAAQLSLIGADVVTARHLHEPAVMRSPHRHAVLILDEDAIAARPDGWLEAALDEPRWRYVIVLSATPPPPDAPGRLIHLDHENAPSAIAALLPRWQAQGWD